MRVARTIICTWIVFLSTVYASTRIIEIQYVTDDNISPLECAYITQLAVGDSYDERILKNAVARLEHMHRWGYIDPRVEQTSLGVKLHFYLRAAWRFKQVQIKGIFWNAHEYADLYLMRPGDPLRLDVHEASLRGIKEFAEKKGYFACSLRDEFVYNAQDKTVTVVVHVATGQQFRIYDWRLHVEGISDPIKRGELIAVLRNKIRKKTLKKPCTQRRVEHQLSVLDRLLHAHYLRRSQTQTISEIIGKRAVALRTAMTVEPLQNIQWNQLSPAQHALVDEVVQRQQQLQKVCDGTTLADSIRTQLYNVGYLAAAVHASESSESIALQISPGERYERNTIRVKIEDGEIDKCLEQIFIDRDLPPCYVKKIYDEDISEIERQFRNKGWWDFHVVRMFVRPYHKKKQFDLIYVVHKGVQRIARAVKVITSSPDFSFKKNLACDDSEGTPLCYETLCTQEHQLFKQLHEKGYWFASVEAQIHAVAENKKKALQQQTVDLTWLVTPGQQVQYGPVYVRGCTRFSHDRVRRCVPCKQGAPWNNAELEVARQRLEMLGIFKEVHVYPLFGYDDPYRKPVVVELVEDERYECRLRGGYYVQSRHGLPHAESTIKAGGAFIVKNPANRGDICFIDGELGRFEKRIEARYQMPLGATHSYVGRLKGYVRSYDQPRILGGDGNAYTLDQQGFFLNLDALYDADSHWGCVGGVEWNRIRNVHGDIKLDPALINIVIPQLTFEPSLLVEATDDKLATTRGWIGFASSKVVIPCRAAPAHMRYLLELALFYPAHARLVAACKMRIGQVIGAPCDQINPIDRFYLGGPQSIRGYERDSVPPLGIEAVAQPDGSIKKILSVQGGKCMASLNAELRMKLWRNIGAVIFQDIGSLSQAGWAQALTSWYPTSGFGFRYQTPVGALRFDIGWKWKKNYPEEGRYAWYLSLGEAF